MQLERRKELKLFENELTKQRFYQNTKRLIEHPSVKCPDKDRLLLNFFKQCEEKHLLPRPLFIGIVKDNSIVIQDR